MPLDAKTIRYTSKHQTSKFGDVLMTQEYSIETWSDEKARRTVFFASVFGGMAQILALLAVVLLEEGPLPEWFIYLALVFGLLGMTSVIACLIPLCVRPRKSMRARRRLASALVRAHCDEIALAVGETLS